MRELLKELKNRKGFTLVELLAVIVILALIMSIAIYSISGILQNSREGVFKDSALGIIKGVRLQLLSINDQKAGTYFFTEDLLEQSNELPFGGEISYGVESDGKIANKAVTRVKSSSGNMPLYYHSTKLTASDCSASTTASFVVVAQTGNTSKYEYSICLVPTEKGSNSRYIWGTEADLLGNSATVIKVYN